MSATETLVRDYFPEDNQRHSLFYEDSTIQTLNQGIRFLYRVSNSMLRYRQQISIQNLFLDRSYEGLIRHNIEQGILHIRFPSECVGIGRIQNNAKCRMVSYYRQADTGYVREIQITSKTTIDVARNPNMELTIYTNFEKNLVVSFDVYLVKNRNQSLRSAL